MLFADFPIANRGTTMARPWDWLNEKGVKNQRGGLMTFNTIQHTFNYKEGTQTVTFGEATEVASEGNGSDLDCIPALSSDSFQKGCRFSFLYPSFWKSSAIRIRGLEQHGPAAQCRKQSAQWAVA